MSSLQRVLSLPQAVAINIIDMVGIGPFVSMPLVIAAMNGPQCIIAWLLGALLAFSDGCVWAELGARWPEAGGSYAFLNHLFGRQRGGLLSFLYVWQTCIQAPLVVASGAIGFGAYLTYLVPDLDDTGRRLVSGALVILVVVLLYRKSVDIGRISMFLGLIVIGTIVWLIASGLLHFHSEYAFVFPKGAFSLNLLFFAGLGQASNKTVYSYLGYYNVCHLGGEIREPQKNIPRSIFISIAAIAVLYLLMQEAVLGVVPWQEAKGSAFLVSVFFEKVSGPVAAQVATVLVLIIAFSSLFAVLLGYSRVPYAAAADGRFFPIFAKLHPSGNFPYMSLLILGALALAFSLLFKMKEVIEAIVTVRILVQFIGQAGGLLLYRLRNPADSFPYRMWLYPLPVWISLAVWAFIFLSARWQMQLAALLVIGMGVVLYLLLFRSKA